MQDSPENVKDVIRTLVTPDALVAFCGEMPRYTPKESSPWVLAAQVAPASAWNESLLEGLVHNGSWSHMLPRTDIPPSLRNTLILFLAYGLKRDVLKVAWRAANEAMSFSLDQGYLSARDPASRVIFSVATEKRRKVAQRSAMSLALRLPGLTDEDLAILTKNSREFQARIIAHPAAGPLTYAGIAQDIANDPTPLDEDDWFAVYSALYSRPQAQGCPALDAEAVRALGRRSPPQGSDGRTMCTSYGSIEGLWWDVVETAFKRAGSANRRKEPPSPGDISLIRALLPRLMADADSPRLILEAIQRTDPNTRDLLRGTFSAENLFDAAQSAYASSRTAAIFLSQWSEDSHPPVATDAESLPRAMSGPASRPR